MSNATMAIRLPTVMGQAGWYQKIVNLAATVFIFCGMIAFIEPSPYDFASLIAMALWLVGGVRLSGFLVALIVVWTLRECAQFISLTPYWDEPSPVLYQFQSFYLYVTLIFFILFFAERTQERARLGLDVYAFSCVFSATFAIFSYVGWFGMSDYTTIEGRVAGTFKDPNVFGSYLTLGANWLLYNLLIGRSRNALISLAALGIVLIGVFLSFSRGSWGAAVFACGLSTAFAFFTHRDAGTRKRIFIMGGTILCLAAVALMVILSNDTIGEFFFQRFSVTQDYDRGETGRFGNQLRSLPMLLERPLGFGPLRFRLIFDLDPHNSYIGAFANGGWAGGFLWILLIGATVFVGFRLMTQPSPYRGFAQGAFPALLALLLQGFQIDIDHWRQLFFQLGLLWGLEGARRRWLQGEPRN